MAEDPDILKLQPNDNLGISLVTTPLDGSNFLSWSRSIKLAVIAKTKLSFINKDAEIPEKDTKEFKYGQCNGPMEYRLKRELASLSQAKESPEIKSSDQLMQFLMGLNDTYDHVRSQILVMEPYPNVSKAFSMVLRVEKQKDVNTEPQYTSQNVAMQVYKKPDFSRNFQKKRNFVDKKSQVCKECGKSGHLKEVCFEIHGYPEWYKNLMEQRKKSMSVNPKVAVAYDQNERANNAVDNKVIAEVLKTEINKFLGGFRPQTLALTDTAYHDFL
ncbi:UNVERIFIED_CONTAM: hypothetical protein Sindi_2272800, partial [Sesamum indicum]